MSHDAPLAIVVPDSQIDDVLTRAADDWVWAASIYDAARTGDPRGSEEAADDLSARAIALMRALLGERLLVPGRIAFGRFLPWTCSTGEAIEYIATHWRSLPYRLGTLDFFVWFDITDLGLERAERAERAEAGEEASTGSCCAVDPLPREGEIAG